MACCTWAGGCYNAYGSSCFGRLPQKKSRREQSLRLFFCLFLRRRGLSPRRASCAVLRPLSGPSAAAALPRPATCCGCIAAYSSPRPRAGGSNAVP